MKKIESILKIIRIIIVTVIILAFTYMLINDSGLSSYYKGHYYFFKDYYDTRNIK